MYALDGTNSFLDSTLTRSVRLVYDIAILWKYNRQHYKMHTNDYKCIVRFIMYSSNF